MKNLIFIFLLFSSSLFALQKEFVFDVLDTDSFSKMWNTKDYSNASQTCSTFTNDFINASPTTSDTYHTGGNSGVCPNTQGDLLKYKYAFDVSFHTAPKDNCTPLSRDNGSTTYYSGLVSNVHVHCAYECKVIPKPDNEPNAIWDDDECQWIVPCTDTVPNDWIGYPMANNDCVPYQNLTSLQKQIYPKQGIKICTTCYVAPYDNDSCPTPSVLDTSGAKPKCITPACPSGQFLDANSTCQDLSIPSDFPSDKGHQSIREDGNNFTPSSCVPGKVFKSGIAYAKVIGWNSEKNVCEIATLFCDSGFTFDSVTNTCVAPSDTKTFDPNKDEISQALADACTSGKWAKKWTLDYCNQPTCYIGLNEQNYNLHCGNMYFEYDCTSDYRLRKYVQVSCGEPLDKDKDTTSLIVGDSSTSGSADGNATSGSGSGSNYVPDLNTTTTNLNVVSAINSASSGLSNSISALDSHVLGASSKLGSIDGKLSSIASDVGSIKDALHAGDDKVGDLDNITNSNGTGSADGFFDKVKKSYSDVGMQFDDMTKMINSGFSYSPPTDGCYDPSDVVHGKTITLKICEPLSKFRPFVYFILMFSFTFLGIKIFLLGLAI